MLLVTDVVEYLSPFIPDVPAVPELPEVPLNPDVPLEPDVPELPDVPEAPDVELDISVLYFTIPSVPKTNTLSSVVDKEAVPITRPFLALNSLAIYITLFFHFPK